MPSTTHRNGGGRLGHPQPVGPPQLPSLAGIPAEIAVYEKQAGFVDLAQTMVRAGLTQPGDWDTINPAPGRIIGRAIERAARRPSRGLPDTMPIYAFARPWSEVVRTLIEDDVTSDRRWVLGLESEETHRIRVGPLVAGLGEEATALVLTRLLQHTPLCTEGPDDLEWIIDGWHETGREPGSQATEIRQRAKDAAELGARVNALLARGHAVAENVPLPRSIRRHLRMLETLARSAPKANDTAWRETEDVEWALPRPVFQLIWDTGCALDHAVAEAEYILNEDGSFPCPQQMWILDPRDPADAACTWKRWVHALFQVRVTTRLLYELDTVADIRTYP